MNDLLPFVWFLGILIVDALYEPTTWLMIAVALVAQIRYAADSLPIGVVAISWCRAPARSSRCATWRSSMRVLSWRMF